MRPAAGLRPRRSVQTGASPSTATCQHGPAAVRPPQGWNRRRRMNRPTSTRRLAPSSSSSPNSEDSTWLPRLPPTAALAGAAAPAAAPPADEPALPAAPAAALLGGGAAEADEGGGDSLARRMAERCSDLTAACGSCVAWCSSRSPGRDDDASGAPAPPPPTDLQAPQGRWPARNQQDGAARCIPIDGSGAESEEREGQAYRPLGAACEGGGAEAAAAFMAW